MAARIQGLEVKPGPGMLPETELPPSRMDVVMEDVQAQGFVSVQAKEEGLAAALQHGGESGIPSNILPPSGGSRKTSTGVTFYSAPGEEEV